MKKGTSIPFLFVLENLFSLNPMVKPMFGCHAVYVGEKIMLIMRNKSDNHDFDNGIWISTKSEHHETLKKIFPSMRSIQVLGNGATNWQNLPLDADDFEESANQICELILKNDPRIGNVPKARKSKKKVTKKR
ncbi:MAG TPA: hypothetical protein VGK39_07970 [Cyclobacteriaceae bacterium]